jgi:DNA polymerase elongation subunit (family B)
MNLPIVNISNKKSHIYLFCRDEKGKLSVKLDKGFKPYYYTADKDGAFTTIYGDKVRKVCVTEPNEIRKVSDKNSWESDINYSKRYVIDKIDSFEKCPIKWAMIDVEVLHPENEYPDPMTALFPVSCISLYNSFYKVIRTWYIEDFGTDIKDAEIALFKAFIDYMKKANFDLWLSYYGTDFDYPYLFRRFERLPQEYFFENNNTYNNFATLISPIGQVRGGNKLYNNFYPAGISIVDYLSWIKKIYKDERDYSLDGMGIKYCKRGKKYAEIDFSKLSQEVKERNSDDVALMVDLENKFKLIPLYDEMRRMAKVGFEDFNYPLRSIDNLILQEAKRKKVILPSSKGEEHADEEFEGAWRTTFDTGLFEQISCYDISGAYPAAIIDLCLDITNLTDKPGKNIISVNITDRETNTVVKQCYIKQNPEALLPSVMKILVVEKGKFGEKKSNLNPATEEFTDAKLKYEAFKCLVNSGWGVNGNRFFRLYSSDVAGLITSVVRDVLHYLKDHIGTKYEVLYTDTDGLMINDKGADSAPELNKLIQQWSQEKFGKSSTIKIEKKGTYEQIFILTMCRYKGFLRNKKGLETEVKGLQIKRKDSTDFIAKFQEEVLTKIFAKQNKEQLVDFVNDEKERIKNLPLKEISFPTKLNQLPGDYKTSVTNKHGTTYNKKPPVHVQALLNTQLIIPEFKKRLGEKYYWIYCTGEKDNVPFAFDDKIESSIKSIAWDKMLERNIDNIVIPIFEAMKWSTEDIIAPKIRKTRKKKETIDA